MGEDVNFLSAISLFRVLYKSEKGDIYTLLTKFIVSAIKQRSFETYTEADVSELLTEYYGFDKLPNAVICRCLYNSKVFTKNVKNGTYSLIEKLRNGVDTIRTDVYNKSNTFGTIIKSLILYINEGNLVDINQNEQDDISNEFLHTIMNKENSNDCKYFRQISKFILERETDQTFCTFINSIREGLIIYNGIRYNLQANGKTWDKDTVFFLDVHYLFSAYGLNGEIFKQYFFDFYNLQKEINDGTPKRHNKSKIRLFYLKQTKIVVEKFFDAAEKIKTGTFVLENPTTAMQNILNKCSDTDEIIALKSKLFIVLNKLGIKEYNVEFDFNKDRDCIFETSELIEELSKKYSIGDFDDAKEMLKIADYIHKFRKNDTTARYVFLSDSKMAIFISKMLKEYDAEAKSHIFERMDFYTERMWFNLKKCLSSNSDLSSFDIIMRTKISVDGLLQSSLTKAYDDIKSSDECLEFKQEFYLNLRTQEHNPDNVTSENIDETFEFLSINSRINQYKESQNALKNKAQLYEKSQKDLDLERLCNSKLTAELLIYKQTKNKKLFLRRKIVKILFRISKIYIIVWYIILLFIPISAVYFFYKKETFCSILSLILSILSFLPKIRPAKIRVKHINKNIYIILLKLFLLNLK